MTSRLSPSEKVVIYITHHRRLLVFRHTAFLEASIQVPAGSLEPGEAPELAARREAQEESGLAARRKRMKRIAITWLILLLVSGCTLQTRSNASAPTRPPTENGPLPGQGGAPVKTIDPLQPTQPFQPTPAAPEEAARQLMLFSHTKWQSLMGDAVVNSYPQGGSGGLAQVQRVRVWIRQPGEARWASGPAQGNPDTLWVSDGKKIRDFSGETYALPPSVLEPFNPPVAFSDTIQPHPLAGTMGGPLMDMLFPTGLAQRSGEYRLAGRESLAGRQALLLEWSYTPGELADRFWVDAETGILLRWQNYGKQRQDAPLSDAYFTHIEYNPELPASTFDLTQTLADLGTGAPVDPQGKVFASMLKSESGYINLRSGPGTTYDVIAKLEFGQSAPVTGKSAGGEWYQVEYNGQAAWVYAPLVQLVGDPRLVPVVKTP